MAPILTYPTDRNKTDDRVSSCYEEFCLSTPGQIEPNLNLNVTKTTKINSLACLAHVPIKRK